MMLTDHNTFRHKDGPALRCAVQLTRPLPGFLGTGEWEWNGVLLRGGRPPSGFVVEVAAYVSDLSGYYFYYGRDPLTPRARDGTGSCSALLKQDSAVGPTVASVVLAVGLT